MCQSFIGCNGLYVPQELFVSEQLRIVYLNEDPRNYDSKTIYVGSPFYAECYLITATLDSLRQSHITLYKLYDYRWRYQVS